MCGEWGKSVRGEIIYCYLKSLGHFKTGLEIKFKEQLNFKSFIRIGSSVINAIEEKGCLDRGAERFKSGRLM